MDNQTEFGKLLDIGLQAQELMNDAIEIANDSTIHRTTDDDVLYTVAIRNLMSEATDLIIAHAKQARGIVTAAPAPEITIQIDRNFKEGDRVMAFNHSSGRMDYGRVTLEHNGQCCITWDNGMTGSFTPQQLCENDVRKAVFANV